MAGDPGLPRGHGDPHPGAHLHWPLSTSQVGSMSSWTPGPEQLHSSQPTRGWQPKVCGWQMTQSGGTVRGGQMHWPVSSSQRRPLQSQAVGRVHRPRSGDPTADLGTLNGGWRGRGHPTPSLVPPSSGPQAPGSSSDVASAGQNCCLVPGTSCKAWALADRTWQGRSTRNVLLATASWRHPWTFPRTGVLTPAAGEAPVASGTAGAVTAYDVGAAGTLAPERLTRGSRGAHLMAAARPSPVVIEEGEGGGGVAAEG